MTRQNLFSDVWDGDDEDGRRHRVFWQPSDARMGATLYQLAPGAPEGRLHMHFGAKEMFFVLSGRPMFRNPQGREQLAQGDFVFCPEGRAGLHAFSNPTDEPAEILAMSAGGFPDVVAYPDTVRVGRDARSRPQPPRKGRRSRHHRPVRDPDRVDRSDRKTDIVTRPAAAPTPSRASASHDSPEGRRLACASVRDRHPRGRADATVWASSRGVRQVVA